MISNDEIIEIVNKLFKKPWKCIAHKEDMAIIRDLPEKIDVDVTRFSQCGTGTEGVTRIETVGNMQGIIDMLYNVPRITADQQMFPDLNLIKPDEVALCTADIAEIVFKGGAVHLIDPLDSVEIHESIRNYINLVDRRRKYEPHFQPPPEEDMLAFTKLYNLLEEMVKRYEPQGMGNSAFATLINLGINNATRLNTTEKPTLVLDGSRNSATIDNHFGKHKDPYSFSNFRF